MVRRRLRISTLWRSTTSWLAGTAARRLSSTTMTVATGWKNWIRTVVARRWELFAYVLMSNHFHLFLRTPEPDLSRGMHRMLSAYATRWTRRHRRTGHVFQGRVPSPAHRGRILLLDSQPLPPSQPRAAKLVGHPRDWEWSSYRGYDSRRRRLDWVAYETLLAAMQGDFGGTDPASTYRRFVTAGLAEPIASPFSSAWQGWYLAARIPQPGQAKNF